MAIDTPQPPAAPLIERIIIVLLLLGLPALSIWSLQPPAPLPADAPPEVFSAERAMRHVEAIAQAPHPTGSAENQRVRDYLFGVMQDLGLNPRIESRDFHWQGRDWTLHNLVGVLEGSGELPSTWPSGGAVLLMAHYDSVSAGPGAADDAAGVAAILEAIRAIRSGPPLNNDIIVLLTDGEEQNLLGARATVEQADWLNDVSVVLNFEARGTSGPSIMFEANANWWLIEQLAETPHAVANSLADDIYEQMPNDTDFTVFDSAYPDEKRLDHPIHGLNFAFIDGASRYHTAADTPQNLSLASLQHHGEYALHLTRRLGETEALTFATWTHRRLGGTGFFPLPLKGLVTYPLGLAIFPVYLAPAWVLALIALKHGRLRPQLVRGLSMLVMLAAVAATATLAWGLLNVLPYHRPQPHGYLPDEWQSRIYLMAFMSLAVAVHFGIVANAARKWGINHFDIGAIWLNLFGLIALIAWRLPGGSYLCLFPLIVALLTFPMRAQAHNFGRFLPVLRLAGNALLLGTTLLLYVPLIHLLTVAISIRAGFIAAAMASFALAVLSLPLQQLAPRRPWIIALGAGGVAAVLLIIGSLIG